MGGSCAASRPRPLRPRASCSAAPTPSVHTCVAALPAGGSAVAVGPASGAGSSRAGPSLPRRSRAASISPRPQPHASKRGVVKTQFSGGTKAKKFGSLPSCSAWKPDSSIQRNGPAAKRPKDAAAEKEPVVLFAPKVLSEDPALKEPTWERPVFRKGRRPTKVKMRLWGKQPDPRQGPKWSASMPWAWTCPIHTCGLVIKGTYSGVSQARYFHVRSKHPEVDPSFFHSEPPDVPVATSPDLPKAQRAWSCPLCSHGLPALSLQVKKRAVRAHCAAFHPKETMRSLCNLNRKGVKNNGVSVHQKKGHQAGRLALFSTHTIVPVECVEKKLKDPNWRGQSYYCSKCFSQLRGRTAHKADMSCQDRQAELRSNGWVLSRKRAWWNSWLANEPQTAQSFLKNSGLTQGEISATLKLDSVSGSSRRWKSPDGCRF